MSEVIKEVLPAGYHAPHSNGSFVITDGAVHSYRITDLDMYAQTDNEPVHNGNITVRLMSRIEHDRKLREDDKYVPIGDNPRYSIYHTATASQVDVSLSRGKSGYVDEVISTKDATVEREHAEEEASTLMLTDLLRATHEGVKRVSLKRNRKELLVASLKEATGDLITNNIVDTNIAFGAIGVTVGSMISLRTGMLEDFAGPAILSSVLLLDAVIYKYRKQRKITDVIDATVHKLAGVDIGAEVDARTITQDIANLFTELPDTFAPPTYTYSPVQPDVA